MAINITEDLKPIRYYTGLDPYFYTVDNRPFADVDENMSILTQALEGAFLGNSLTQAIVSRLFAVTTTASPVYYGREMDFNNLVGSLPEGVMVFDASYDNFNASQRRHLALSFAPFSTEFSAPPSGKTRVYLVQAAPASVTTESQVPFIGSSSSNHYGAISSLLRELKVSIKYQDIDSGSIGQVIPGAGQTGLVKVTVPSGTTQITEDMVEYLKDFKFESELLNKQKPVADVEVVAADTVLDINEGRYFELTLKSSTQIETKNVPLEGATDVTLKIVQDGTGERTFEFPSGSVFVSGSANMVGSDANSETWVRMVSYNGEPWRIFAM